MMCSLVVTYFTFLLLINLNKFYNLITLSKVVECVACICIQIIYLKLKMKNLCPPSVDLVLIELTIFILCYYSLGFIYLLLLMERVYTRKLPDIFIAV